MTLEIYLKDLTKEAQKKVLEFFKISSEEEGNLDITPLFIFEEIEGDLYYDVIDPDEIRGIEEGLKDAREGNFVDDKDLG